METKNVSEIRHVDVIVVGAGMSGIGCAAGLKQFGIDDFIILEKGNTINQGSQEARDILTNSISTTDQAFVTITSGRSSVPAVGASLIRLNPTQIGKFSSGSKNVDSNELFASNSKKGFSAPRLEMMLIALLAEPLRSFIIARI